MVLGGASHHAIFFVFGHLKAVMCHIQASLFTAMEGWKGFQFPEAPLKLIKTSDLTGGYNKHQARYRSISMDVQQGLMPSRATENYRWRHVG